MSHQPLFHTDPIALVVVAVCALPFVGFWWVGRRVDQVPPLRRRFTVPQRGPAAGTGVEAIGVTPSAGARSDLTGHAAKLPRSPQTSAGATDPRPVAPAGPLSPAGAADLFADTAPAGLHRRPVIIHER